jgi:hypothetical protein
MSIDRAVIDAVARTLRYISCWADEDRAAPELIELAGIIEREYVGGDGGGCCPVCQEVTCDDGCPLKPVRDEH